MDACVVVSGAAKHREDCKHYVDACVVEVEEEVLKARGSEDQTLFLC